MRLEAAIPAGKVSLTMALPPTTEDLRRLSALCAFIPDAEWTAKPEEKR